ncbi:MAG: S8 family serine peptidase [Bacteroidota bacterium]
MNGENKMSERFYYAENEKVPLIPSWAFVAVQFSSDADESARSAAVEKKAGMASLDQGEFLEPFDITLIPTASGATEEAVVKSAEALSADSEVEGTIPVFQMPQGEPDEVMILIPQFRVQFKPEVSEADIEKLNKKHNAEVVAKEDLGPNSYLLRLTPKAKQDALDLANLYHENEMVEYAEPDWVYKMRRMAPPVDDPHYGDQWALAKMNVPQAWGINRGRANIKIAIIDEGTQTSHPDLAAKIVTPYDAVGDDNNQEPNSWDGHGTACAGIAAAVTDNARGVAGVASECAILPVRIAYSSQPGANWTTNATWIARGIRTAVDRGADVLSNSWGGGPYNTTIRNAFIYARTNGRGGKGCLSISASGNGDVRGIIYPARYPESLACGASNEWDQRKSRTSLDGENWWGSNYGPEQDFLAPGVHIYTTDITGNGGYGSGDYYHRFNGTSSATPNAAGVAGLILSVDPNLRQWEVRDILRLTARDLGGRGWDEQYGWGRINAQKALQAAARLWYQVRLRPEFLGSGQECYMRFQVFRLYNSGLNRVRVNNFNIRSYSPSGTEIDRFEYQATPGGVMLPGIAPGGGSGNDLQVQGLLLKANGNRSRWSYRWRANWGYTYWRPSAAVTTPAEALAAGAAEIEEEVDQEFEITVESTEEGKFNPSITVDDPLIEESEQEGESLVFNKNDRPVKISVTVE